MAEIKLQTKDAVYGSGIILLILILGITLTDTTDWYFCEVENSIKECSDLTKYGVENAKCIGTNGVNDICTAGGIKHAWQPLDNYISINTTDKHVVESLQECKIENYTIFEPETYSCIKTVYNYTDCADMLPNGTCTEYTNDKVNSTCYSQILVTKNRTVCEPIGYNVTYSNGNNYEITGDCCGYFNDTKQIICKEEINNICNPVCQQTDKVDPNNYDEYCIIYDLLDTSINPHVVGDTDYVRDYQIKLSDYKVKKGLK